MPVSSPMVFDTHELGRRPGAEKAYTRTIEAPADLGHDVYGVPEGSPVELELRLEVIVDGVLVTGSATTHVVGECVRCLDDLEDDLEFDYQELYVFEPVVGEDADDEILALEDDLLDLEPVLRDAVVLALPLNPVCDPDCPGLCPECGARLADDPDHTHGPAIDPRWASLTKLTDNSSDADPAPDTSKE